MKYRFWRDEEVIEVDSLPTFPHCDPRVLHAPGECKYCDECPEWQQLRRYWGISFSGHKPNEEQPIACPADQARGDTYNNWHGNRPQ